MFGQAAKRGQLSGPWRAALGGNSLGPQGSKTRLHTLFTLGAIKSRTNQTSLWADTPRGLTVTFGCTGERCEQESCHQDGTPPYPTTPLLLLRAASPQLLDPEPELLWTGSP
ncbi:unnamed protein product [Pleuronectes platessa]|uniref:Uncharacterized protein n=1 Tax=Pleuronectes platessa TaxID=8262 RepID=A0A9N7UAG2_PLEPL|nr:unnamed protein product [Pleuronectes platessa]